MGSFRLSTGKLSLLIIASAWLVGATTTIRAQELTPTLSSATPDSATRPRRAVITEETLKTAKPETLSDENESEESARPKSRVFTNSDFPSGKAVPTNRLDGLGPELQRLQASIDTKLGFPYRYHSQGEGAYDCSGFVWSVFRDIGVSFTRSCAAEYYHAFPPATAEQKTQFGTLIFFNGLGHIGIVKDANHFYHASTSAGTTLTKLNDYWKARITGYRVVPGLVAPSPELSASSNEE
ncbi:MAG TPA: NlpC/P60 family protein [Acidobacteriota bacterium]|nr:NlpC/P60 family protein [Acidobacteriota bacterium]HNJ42631.1 NlpC/P60 family protein [Acidobacteriota bacterium]